MTEVIVTSIMLKLGLAFLGILLLFVALRLFDKAADIKFRETFDIIEKDGHAAALYLGLRFLGVCIVLAAALL